jgi:hypothetical protein
MPINNNMYKLIFLIFFNNLYLMDFIPLFIKNKKELLAGKMQKIENSSNNFLNCSIAELKIPTLYKKGIVNYAIIEEDAIDFRLSRLFKNKGELVFRCILRKDNSYEILNKHIPDFFTNINKLKENNFNSEKDPKYIIKFEENSNLKENKILENLMNEFIKSAKIGFDDYCEMDYEDFDVLLNNFKKKYLGEEDFLKNLSDKNNFSFSLK